MKNTKLYHFKVVNATLVWYNMVVVLGLLRRKGRRRLGKTKRDQKRRDKKGRILRNGESQRKDGRYAFVYTDCYGKQKFLYSWKLEPTDSLPTGCRPCLALREKEKNILQGTVKESVEKPQGRCGVRFQRRCILSVHTSACNFSQQKKGLYPVSSWYHKAEAGNGTYGAA